MGITPAGFSSSQWTAAPISLPLYIKKFKNEFRGEQNRVVGEPQTGEIGPH